MTRFDGRANASPVVPIRVMCLVLFASAFCYACKGDPSGRADADGGFVKDASPADGTIGDGASADGAGGDSALPEAPPPPTGVSATTANGEITISWNAVAGAGSYALYWSRAPGVTKTTCTQLRDLTATTYVHSGLSPSSTYYYAVTALRGGLESALSTEVSASPAPANPAWSIGIAGKSAVKTDPLEGSLLSMALTPSGGHRIAFFDQTAVDPALQYESDAGGTWKTETIVAGGSGGGTYLRHFVSLAIDSQGNAHVAFFNSTSPVDQNHLRYATNAGGTWAVSVIDGATNVGQYPSVALDSKDKVHVSYVDYNNNSLKYATNASGSWVTTTVDAATSIERSAMVIDSADQPHIIYYRYSSIAEVRHAARDSNGGWSLETIPGAAVPAIVGAPVSAAIDKNDKLHVAYNGNQSLGYASNSSGSWFTTTVASAYRVESTSIGVDSKGAAHIAYAPGSSGGGDLALAYATNAGGSWRTATADGIGYVGFDASLVVDAQGAIQIAYGGRWPNYSADCSVPFNNGVSGYLKYASSAPLLPAMRLAPPPAPTNITGAANGTSLLVKWNCETSPFVGFNIYWSAAAGGVCAAVLDVPGQTPRYRFDGLSYGASYYFTVIAENSGGESAPSTETPIAMPPAPAQPPDGGSSGGCPTSSAQICTCTGGTCFGATISSACKCPPGTSQYGGEIGCAPGQSIGCIQCVC